eukprot:UN09958
MSGPSMKDLYNSQITSTQKVTRTGNWSGSAGKGVHDGTVVTTKHGSYLVHNSPGNNTVVTSTKHMSSKWSNVGSSKSHSDYRVGAAMQTEAKHGSYKYVGNNCVDTSQRVHSGNDDCIIQ